MTKRDFFRIAIKLFGLYSAIVTLFSLFPTYLSYVMYDFKWENGIIVLLGFALVTMFLISFIYSADKIVTWMKLDKGYDDDRIEFGNLNGQQVIRLAVLILGGLLILNNFPDFVSNCYYFFKGKVTTQGLNSTTEYVEQTNYAVFAKSSFSMIIGYLLITNHNALSVWMYKLGDKEVESVD